MKKKHIINLNKFHGSTLYTFEHLFSDPKTAKDLFNSFTTDYKRNIQAFLLSVSKDELKVFLTYLNK